MNNILLNKLPQSVIIGGVEVRINTDFRFSIKFEQLLNEYDLEDEEQQKEVWEQAIKLYYGNISDEFKLEAVDKLLWFHRCGKEDNYNIEEEPKTKEKIISYEQDADKIYSAFIDQYRIDLQECDNLHWWKFKALMDSLKDDTEIKKVMGIRAIDITKVPKEQREYYRKLKKIYEIIVSKEELEEDNDISSILMGGGDLSQLKE